MTSGEEFSYHLAERNYIKEFCKLTLVPYYKLRPRVYQSKRKNQIREFNPYWLIAPSPLKKGRVVYLNYLTLFY